ncbi:MAG: helix-turn-helix domain-containing protein, partial [Verrucomicrobiota bacterium]
MSRLSVVLEAWEIFESKLGGDLNMPDIAERSDISSRTLEYAFKEIVGRTPIGFFKVMRLHRARRLILSGDVPTVRDAATRCGIRHFGRFSIDYRLQFGEQ